MGGCSVASCKNRFIRGTKHFFRFPKDWRRELWMKFTQRGSHFIPKSSSTICEDHFASESCQKKKNRVIMSKEAVPTIMVRDSQQYEIRFDAERRDYFDEDFLSLKLATSQPTETEESVLDQRQSRLDELKTVCRFCISNDGSKVPIAKLATYFITADTITTILGIESPSDDVFSEFLCEQCFTQIVEFDGFRKKVRDAHQEVATEILEFDEKLAEIRNGKVFEVVPIPMMDSTIEFLEEHLLDDDEFMDNEEIEYIEEIAEDISDVADESVKHKELIEQSAQGVDEYDQVTTDDIIKNPDRNRFCFKIYECFFCKMKFAGRKTYVAHKCSVAEVGCEKCDKTFSKLQAYNSHISQVHNSLPIQKHCCPICKTVVVSTLNQFKSHRRLCNKKASVQEIECEVCGKVCNSLKGYTIHKLFHDTRNYTTSTGEKIASDGLNVFKGTAVCELCGKEFQSQSGYRMHRRNVHRVGCEGELFNCQMCPKTCPTRRSLFDHMRNTHRVQETPCIVCGKIFRTKILLKKHMMYHDETKRVFFCKLCPDKPGYFTNVALKRHQKSHVGKMEYHCDDCGAGFSSNHQLKVHALNKHGVN